jgi:hypothetical protein
MNTQEVGIILKMAFAPWPHVEMRPELAIIWEDMLSRYTFNEAREALLQILGLPNREWPPKIGELLEALRAIKKAATPHGFISNSLESYEWNGRSYLRATKETSLAYEAASQKLGIQYRESFGGRIENRYDPSCKIPPAAMKILWDKLDALMDGYRQAKDKPELKAKCDADRDALKEFYFDLAKEF